MSVDLQRFLEQQVLREENCAGMYTRFAGIASDPRLRAMFHDFGREAQAHRDGLRSLLTRQGIPEDGVLQNRATQDATPIGPSAGAGGDDTLREGTPPVRGRDDDMVADVLLSMKSMSEAYRSALRMVADERVAAALIGMRQDEDRMKEQLARHLHESTMHRQ